MVFDRTRVVLKLVPIAGLALICTVGCGGDPTIGTVSGRVTYGGEPLPAVEEGFFVFGLDFHG